MKEVERRVSKLESFLDPSRGLSPEEMIEAFLRGDYESNLSSIVAAFLHGASREDLKVGNTPDILIDHIVDVLTKHRDNPDGSDGITSRQK